MDLVYLAATYRGIRILHSDFLGANAGNVEKSRNLSEQEAFFSRIIRKSCFRDRFPYLDNSQTSDMTSLSEVIGKLDSKAYYY